MFDVVEQPGEKSQQGEGGSEQLIGGMMPGDVDGGGACGEWDDDEAVGAVQALGLRNEVSGDAPVGVVLEVEDQEG